MPPADFRAAAEQAIALIPDGGTVGLGSGRTATAFIRALGERVRTGFRVRGIPTSQASADLAHQLGIPLITFDDVDALDVAIDGADEVDPLGRLIKGYGGALVREKIVAAAARRFVVLVGDDKLVPALGTRGVLPVEVVPFGLTPVRRRLAALDLVAEPRAKDGTLFVTDNGNHILDCKIPLLDDPDRWERDLLAVPGVVGTGLFVGMADAVIVQTGEQVEVRHFPRR